MGIQEPCEVAVLLATYNGAQHVAAQILSLRENDIPFTLHWLDDHSTDETRDVVRTAAREAGIPLREWHQSEHLGLPSSYFRLLQCVEAQIYLFCDQDDIWEAGKITATVEDLRPIASSTALSFTGVRSLGDSSVNRRNIYDLRSDGPIGRYVSEGRIYAFMPGCASAPTQGFTRPLRDLLVEHISVACTYACMHDWWMYDVAVACGSVRPLPDAPTVLYRSHPGSYCATLGFGDKLTWKTIWRNMQIVRRVAVRHAQGLILVAAGLPQGVKLERMLEFAALAAALDGRQSPMRLLRLQRLGFGGTYPLFLRVFNLMFSRARGQDRQFQVIYGHRPAAAEEATRSA